MIKAARILALAPDALALGLAALCLAAAAAGQGGRVSARLDVLNHFAPVWFAGAFGMLVYALAFASPSRRWMIVAIAAAGIVAAMTLILPELTRSIRPAVPAGTGRELTLIQFNGWDQNADIQDTADWVAAQKPDVVVMEEVRPPIRDALVRRGFHFQRGLAHAGIFTRLAPLPAPFAVPKDAWKTLPDFARASFSVDGAPFSVVAVHLVWPTRKRQRPNMAALAELLRRYPADRLIVAGDFNLTPWSFALRRFDDALGLERRDRALFSWPARLSPTARWGWPAPLLPIDHVYAGRAWRTISLVRGPRLGSDHYPLLVRLALTD